MGGHVTLTLKSIPWAPCLTGYTYPYVLVFGPPLRTPVSDNPLFTCFIIIQTIQIDFWWQLKNLPPSKIIYQNDKTSNEVVKFSRPLVLIKQFAVKLLYLCQYLRYIVPGHTSQENSPSSPGQNISGHICKPGSLIDLTAYNSQTNLLYDCWLQKFNIWKPKKLLGTLITRC